MKKGATSLLVVEVQELGKPVPGATVQVMNSNQPAKTTTAGSPVVSFHLPPGQYSVHAISPKGAETGASVKVEGDSTYKVIHFLATA